MPNNKLLQNHKIKNFLALAFAVIIAMGATSVSIIQYNTDKEILCSEVNKKLKSAALNIELVLDQQFFKKMVTKEGISPQEDMKNIKLLSQLAKNTEIDYVYVMILKDNKIYFTSSSAKDEEFNTSKMTYFLDRYDEATPLLLNVLKNNKVAFEEAKDEWGTFRSIFIPRTTKDGIKYILGADLHIDYIQEQLDLFIVKIIFTKLVIISLLALLGFYFVKISREELRDIKNIQKELDEKIEQKTQELAQFNAELEERVAQEVEQNRQKEQQLLQQNRLAQMGEMINMIAHQWRQPLSAINSANNTLIVKAKLGKLDEQNVTKITSKITQFTQYLSETINDFRNFFKEDKEKTDVTFNEIVEDSLKIIDTSLKNRNIELELQLNSTQIFCTYANELKQVVLNLIKNAEDALAQNNKQDPKITIITQQNKLMVKDNAGGIDEAIINKIFEPYFSTKQKDGTGLGLYMSKIIVEQHCHGKLYVKNSQCGAEFTIELGENNA